MAAQPGMPQRPAAPEQTQAKRRKKKSGTLSTILQFAVGLIVIAVVAFVIVWLYVRYYQ